MERDERYDKGLFKIILISILFALLTGCASTPPDMQTMLQNLAKSYPDIWKLVTASAYVLGFLFAFKGVYSLKIYGDMRTMMASNSSLKGPATCFVVSAALIYSPTMFDVLMQTSFGYSTPLSYTNLSLGGWSAASTEALIGLVQVFGVIAFIRGWLYIARSSEQSAQQGLFARGLTHIIGGVMAINIIGTAEIIWNTLGF